MFTANSQKDLRKGLQIEKDVVYYGLINDLPCAVAGYKPYAFALRGVHLPMAL